MHRLLLNLKQDTEYEVFLEQASTGKMETNLGGKAFFQRRTWNGSAVDVKL